jgi:hypothetical protein
MRRSAFVLLLSSVVYFSAFLSATAFAKGPAKGSTDTDRPKPVITGPIDESQLVTLAGNTTPAALRPETIAAPSRTA